MLREYNKRFISPVSPSRTNHTYYGTTHWGDEFDSAKTCLRLKPMRTAPMDFCIVLNSSGVLTGKAENSSVCFTVPCTRSFGLA